MKKKNRVRPVQERSQATVQAIAEAACLLLDELGEEKFSQFSTTRVAEKAGVSIGTLYQYFPDKEALLAEVVDYRYQADLTIAKNTADLFKGQPVKDVIKKIVLEIGEKSFVEKKNLYRILSIHASLIVRPETASQMRELGMRFIHDLLEKDKARIKVKNTRYAAFFIIQTLLDMRRAMFISRPEYIHDPEFIEMLANFTTDFL